MPSAPISLARALSKLGLASRSGARELVAAGRVVVNGRRASDAEALVRMDRDRIAVDGAAVAAARRRYVAFNKPRGLVTTAQDEQGRATVYDALDAGGEWLAPVGRLDKASEGLLLFTNDTTWGQRLLDPSNHVAKTYHVQVNRPLCEEELSRLRQGVDIGGETTLPAQARILRSGGKTCWVEIVLREGRNRQIRRMMEAVGAEVTRLVRVAIGPVALGSLAKGAWRDLTSGEVATLGRAGRA